MPEHAPAAGRGVEALGEERVDEERALGDTDQRPARVAARQEAPQVADDHLPDALGTRGDVGRDARLPLDARIGQPLRAQEARHGAPVGRARRRAARRAVRVQRAQEHGAAAVLRLDQQRPHARAARRADQLVLDRVAQAAGIEAAHVLVAGDDPVGDAVDALVAAGQRLVTALVERHDPGLGRRGGPGGEERDADGEERHGRPHRRRIAQGVRLSESRPRPTPPASRSSTSRAIATRMPTRSRPRSATPS